MPPSNYMLYILIFVGGGIASMLITMGFSVFLIYWSYPVIAVLLIIKSLWRVALQNRSVFWAALIVTASAVCWIIGLLALGFGSNRLWFLALGMGPVYTIFAALAAMRLQEITSEFQFIDSVYIAVFLIVCILAIVAFATAMPLPNMIRNLAFYILNFLSFIGCLLIVWSIFQLNKYINREFWIFGAIALPVGVACWLTFSRLFDVFGGINAGIMFAVFPFLSIFGAIAFSRLTSILSDELRINSISSFDLRSKI